MTTAVKRTVFDRAMGYWEKGQLKDAIPLFQQALKEYPDDLNVIYRTVLTLIALKDYAGCARWLTDLLAHVNAHETEAWLMAGFHHNLGIALEASGRWAEAEGHYRTAIQYLPEAVLSRINLGGIRYRLGQPEEARAIHDEMLALPPDEDAAPAVAFIRLLRGEYRRGFQLYERRWRLPQILAQSYIPKGVKRWHGQPLPAGKRILVVAEQGVGDVLMMARYIPRLRDMGLTPILVVHGGLVRLLQSSFPDCDVYALDEPHADAGWWVPMMSLPYVCGTQRHTIPPAVCLTPPPCPFVLPKVKFRVGWVHRGNPMHMGDKDRSCHAPDGWNALTAPLDGVEFLHLAEFAVRDRFGARDMADTAGLLQQCDLVVSVDSAIGHCAGALGVPVWMLPPCAPEWRWGEPGTAGNEWYPTTHTLFRRHHVDDWPVVVQRVRARLEAR